MEASRHPREPVWGMCTCMEVLEDPSARGPGLEIHRSGAKARAVTKAGARGQGMALNFEVRKIKNKSVRDDRNFDRHGRRRGSKIHPNEAPVGARNDQGVSSRVGKSA